MEKIDTLRAVLTEAIPELKREPERLRMWVEDGAGSSRQTGTLAFGFTYRLNILLVEMSTDIALIALPIFRWLRVNQPDLLAPGKEGFSFDADVLDNRACDIVIQIDLTENVTVAPREGGGWSLDYLSEPDPLFEDGEPPEGLPEAPDLTEVIATGHQS